MQLSDLTAPDNKPIFVCLVLAIAGFFLPFPYGFYTVLKLVFFGVLIWLCLRRDVFRTRSLQSPQGVLMILALLLYNPIFPIHLGSRFIWVVLNVGTIALMLWITTHKDMTVSE